MQPDKAKELEERVKKLLIGQIDKYESDMTDAFKRGVSMRKANEKDRKKIPPEGISA